MLYLCNSFILQVLYEKPLVWMGYPTTEWVYRHCETGQRRVAPDHDLDHEPDSDVR
ncbi:MAG: hypothetical protein NVS4B8_27640 [Herpetosiphon sp.]